QVYTQEEAAFNTVRNNKFHDNGLNRSTHDFPDGIVAGAGPNYFYNNLVYDNPGSGFNVQCAGAHGSLIYNNTIYNNSQYAVAINTCPDQPSGTDIENNISYMNTSGFLIDGGTGTTVSTNFCQSSATGCSVTGDPMFVSAPTDLHLQMGSGALGAFTN